MTEVLGGRGLLLQGFVPLGEGLIPLALHSTS